MRRLMARSQLPMSSVFVLKFVFSCNMNRSKDFFESYASKRQQVALQGYATSERITGPPSGPVRMPQGSGQAITGSSRGVNTARFGDRFTNAYDYNN